MVFDHTNTKLITLKKKKANYSSGYFAIPASHARMACPRWSFPLLVGTGGCKTGPLQTRIRLVSWGRPLWMGVMSVGVGEGVRLSPPCVISAWWPRPHRHRRVADVICSHSAVTWRNGNQWWRWKGGLRQKRERAICSAHVFIYLTLWTLQDLQKTIPPPQNPDRILMQAAAVKMWDWRALG